MKLKRQRLSIIIASILIVLCLSVLPALSQTIPLEQNSTQEQKNSFLSTKKQIPNLGSQVPEFGSLASKSFSGLAYCLLAVFVGFAIYRKLNPNLPKTDKGEISICEKKSLSPKTALLVVRVSGEKLLLAQNGDNLQFLTTLSDELNENEIFEAELSNAVKSKNFKEEKNVQTL